MNAFNRLITLTLLCSPVAFVAGCIESDDPVQMVKPEVTAYALSATNSLVPFEPTTGITGSPITITGLTTGDSVIGIDFRPQDGALVALARNTATPRLYTVNTSTGAATPISCNTITEAPDSTPFTLTGASYGVDFNPAANRLRIVSDTEENYRLNLTVSPCTVTRDTALTAGTVVDAAYTNNFHNAAITTLYNIDSASDMLVLQGGVDGSPSPNLGAITNVGLLGVDTTAEVGFDIDSVTGRALASLTLPGRTTSRLYSINLATGAASFIGSLEGVGTVTRDIALVPSSPALAFGTTFNTTTLVNQLVSFVPSTAGVTTVTTVGNVTGLQAGESIVGIDFRPANGFLYALGSTNRVYTINTTTAAATQVGSTVFTPPAGSGTAFGFDFNPVPDRIRVISDAEQNFRLHPDTGARADAPTADTALSPAGDNVAAAYTNNFDGADSTTLFVIDTTAGQVKTQGSIGGTPASPNGGVLTNLAMTLTNIVPTGSESGFDIIGGAGVNSMGTNIGDTIAYAALRDGVSSELYLVNLQTGVATQIGAMPIGGSSPILLRALAVRVQ